MAMVMEPVAPWLRDLNRYFAGTGTAGGFVPAADVLVTEAEVAVYMDVPGVGSDQLEIELENDVLTVRGERALPVRAGIWRAPVAAHRARLRPLRARPASPKASTPTRSRRR